MMDIVLVHGAYHGAWCWELLVPELERLGHRAITMDLPISDPAAGGAAYARSVEQAITAAGIGSEPPVLVAHSAGGLVTPLVAAARPIRRLIFLAAFLPSPGRSANEQRAAEPIDAPVTLRTAQWTDMGDDVWLVGPDTARELFFHDLRPELAAWATARLRAQCYRPMSEPTPLAAWPDVESRVIVCADDRAINARWLRSAARERLGVDAVELPGGHSPFLSRPGELARAIDSLA